MNWSQKALLEFSLIFIGMLALFWQGYLSLLLGLELASAGYFILLLLQAGLFNFIVRTAKTKNRNQVNTSDYS